MESSTRTTAEELLRERDENRRKAFERDDDSGVFLGLAKRALGWELLHVLCGRFLRWKLRSKLKDEMSKEAADRLVMGALECYSIVTMVLLLLSYTSVYCAKSIAVLYVIWAVGVLGAAFPAYRLAEIASFLVQLHGGDDYSTTARMRAVLRTLWHYFECVVAFGTLYLIAYFFGDCFSAQSTSRFVATWLTPLYFSFVTITTLGYGDFSPQSLLGQLLVMLEVVLGIALFLIVLQRALSARRKTPDLGTQTGGSTGA
jgi:hypothetical protein